MKHVYVFVGIAFLTALLISGCGLLGSDDENEEIFLRISNQTGFDFEWYKIRINIGEANAFESFEFEFLELADGEHGEYIHLLVIADQIDGYIIRVTKFVEEIGFQLSFNLDSSFNEEDRALPITSGYFTYILEFTERDFVYYTISQDRENDVEVRIRVQNVGGVDYDEVSVWLWDDDDFMGQEFEIGPVADGQLSSYFTVEDALQFTRIRAVTAQGDTVDNEPLTHFGTELPPGDYTYHVDVKTDSLHDNSRIVKD